MTPRSAPHTRACTTTCTRRRTTSVNATISRRRSAGTDAPCAAYSTSAAAPADTRSSSRAGISRPRCRSFAGDGRTGARKGGAAGLDAEFIEGDVRDAEAGGPFDAALLMFAVLGYQVTNSDVRATFANARRHLRSGGLLVFDAWHGPGVLSDPPDSRRRVIETPDGAVTREATAELDVRRHLWHGALPPRARE